MRGRNCRRLSYAEPSAVSNAIGYVMHRSGNVIETHEHAGDFKEA
jgi:hypothetical protein